MFFIFVCTIILANIKPNTFIFQVSMSINTISNFISNMSILQVFFSCIKKDYILFSIVITHFLIKCLHFIFFLSYKLIIFFIIVQSHIANLNHMLYLSHIKKYYCFKKQSPLNMNWLSKTVNIFYHYLFQDK